MPVTAGLAVPVHAGVGLDHLVALYQQTETRIRRLIEQAAVGGNLGSEHFYRLQMLQVQAALVRLHAMAPQAATTAVEAGYLRAANAVDGAAGGSPVGGAFAGVNEPAIRQLAASLATPLAKIAQTVGRQSADVFRQVGLRQAAIGIGAGLPRADVAAGVVKDLSHQGVTAFVDKGGRRWAMSSYANMVARTVTREAVTAGTIDRMQAHGLDLVTISVTEGACEICQPYEDQTYSISGDSTEYEQPDDWPPYHPNCTHVATPAASNMDSFLADLSGG